LRIDSEIIRVGRTTHQLDSAPDDIEIRVAASVAHLGLIARLLAPAIEAVTLGHSPVSLSLDDLWQNQLVGIEIAWACDY
jgi:hypothetical protein